jgi:hypothetical protein
VVGAEREVDRHDSEHEADSDETEPAPDSLACSWPGAHASTIARLLVWSSPCKATAVIDTRIRDRNVLASLLIAAGYRR